MPQAWAGIRLFILLIGAEIIVWMKTRSGTAQPILDKVDGEGGDSEGGEAMTMEPGWLVRQLGLSSKIVESWSDTKKKNMALGDENIDEIRKAVNEKIQHKIRKKEKLRKNYERPLSDEEYKIYRGGLDWLNTL